MGANLPDRHYLTPLFEPASVAIIGAIVFETGWPLLLIGASIYAFSWRSRIKKLDLPALAELQQRGNPCIRCQKK